MLLRQGPSIARSLKILAGSRPSCTVRQPHRPEGKHAGPMSLLQHRIRRDTDRRSGVSQLSKADSGAGGEYRRRSAAFRPSVGARRRRSGTRRRRRIRARWRNASARTAWPGLDPGSDSLGAAKRNRRHSSADRYLEDFDVLAGAVLVDGSAHGPWQDSMYYAWIIVGIGALIQVPLRSLQSAQIRRVLEQLQDSMKNIPPDAQDAINRVLDHLGGASLASGIFGFIMTLIFYPVLLFIGSAILHLFCMLFGCAKNGYWATFRVSAYATSPLVFYGIPCLGFIAWVYSLVLSILGIARVQDSTVGRATAAALSPVVLSCCCCCGVFTLAAGAIAHHLPG